jgi:hypothetical protein
LKQLAADFGAIIGQQTKELLSAIAHLAAAQPGAAAPIAGRGAGQAAAPPGGSLPSLKQFISQFVPHDLGAILANLRGAYQTITTKMLGGASPAQAAAGEESQGPASLREHRSAITQGLGRMLTGQGPGIAPEVAGAGEASAAGGAAGAGAGGARALGGVAFGAGAAAGAVAGLALAAVAAYKGITSMAESALHASFAFAELSPSMAAIQGQAEIRETFRGMAAGEARAGSAAQLSNAWQDQQDILQPIRDDIANAWNWIATNLTKFLTEIITMIKPIWDTLKAILARLGIIAENTDPERQDRDIGLGEFLKEVKEDYDRNQVEARGRLNKIARKRGETPWHLGGGLGPGDF